jgi:hypothetical protein
MAMKLSRDILQSDLAAVQRLLSRVGPKDPLARITLTERKNTIERELTQLDADRATLGTVLLSFEGGPVRGSYGIDADFAGRALQDYQELIAKQLAARDSGGLAQRGPVPDRQVSRLNVTNVVHGSFGFLLEEDREDEPQMFDSAVKQAISKVSDLFTTVTAPDPTGFLQALEYVDPRVFISLRKFIEDLYREGSSMKVYEEDRDLNFDVYAVNTARERMRAVDVTEDEVTIEGELLGIVPIQRRFDFRDRVTGEVIKGKVGQRLSADYLERIHRDEQTVGRHYRASMLRRSVRRADGVVATSWTLLDLNDITD